MENQRSPLADAWLLCTVDPSSEAIVLNAIKRQVILSLLVRATKKEALLFESHQICGIDGLERSTVFSKLHRTVSFLHSQVIAPDAALSLVGDRVIKMVLDCEEQLLRLEYHYNGQDEALSDDLVESIKHQARAKLADEFNRAVYNLNSALDVDTDASPIYELVDQRIVSKLAADSVAFTAAG